MFLLSIYIFLYSMPNTLKEAKYQDTKTANTLADFVMTIGNQVSLNISSVLNK